MKGNFSRFRTGNETRYDAVLQQQGRVSLDSDWNEAAAIVARQQRQRTIDAFGHFAAVDDGFKVTYLPELRDLLIEPGRAYLAGLLVEAAQRHAVEVDANGTDLTLTMSPDTARDAVRVGGVYVLRTRGTTHEILIRIASLDTRNDSGASTGAGRARGGAALVAARATIARQSDRALATEVADAAGPSTIERVMTVRSQDVELPPDLSRDGGLEQLVRSNPQSLVLDVWQSHVTAVEDPNLLEPALGGPDTTTRLRTEWAVRLADSPQDATCSADLPEPAEPGRVSAWVVEGAEFEDPCLLPSDAGYRGLENRLYRIEVHEGNGGGTTLDDVTFKWSRDNGMAVASVTGIDGDTLVVNDLGADADGLRGAPLVEVFDVVNDRTPSPGLLLEPNTNVQPANNEIEFAEDVSTHEGRPWVESTLRARRWDGQISNVQPGTAIEIEAGIHVSFRPGSFRPGDYWLVPARTASGTIDELDDAVPFGVEHHYAKLAVVGVGTAGGSAGSEAVAATDCRPCLRPITEFTSQCEALITVGDCGDVRTLPEAIALVEGDPAVYPTDTLVTIKLLPGAHAITEPVRIRRGNVRVTGCGTASDLTCSGTFSALAIGAGGTNRISNVTLDGFAISGAAPRGLIAARGVTGFSVSDVVVTLGGPPLAREGAAALATSSCRNVEVVGCTLEGRAAVDDLGADGELLRFPQFGTISVDGRSVLIRNNTVRGAGIWIRHGSTDVRVDDNHIVGIAGPPPDPGVTPPRSSFARSFAGVVLGGLDPTMPLAKDDADVRPDDLALSGVQITRNRILRRTGSGIGTLAADAVNVHYPNLVLPPISIDPAEMPVGKLATFNWCFDRVSVAQPISLVAAIAAAGTNAPARNNLAAALAWAVDLLPLKHFLIAGRAVSPLAEPAQLVVAGNDIRGCADRSDPDPRIVAHAHGGIVLEGVHEVDITANSIVGNGPESRAVGIWLDDVLEARIQDNEVDDNGIEDDPEKPPKIVDFKDVVFTGARETKAFSGVEMLTAEHKNSAVAITARSADTAAPSRLPVAGAMVGQPLGPIVSEATAIRFAEEGRGTMLGLSVLPAETTEAMIAGNIRFEDDTQLDVTVDPNVEYLAKFDKPIKSLELTPSQPFIITTLWWGPVAVQAGIVVLGATGSRAFGKASRRTLWIDRNTVTTPAGLALAAQMVGDGAVVNNVLVSKGHTPQPTMLTTRLGSGTTTSTGSCVAVEQRSSLLSLGFAALAVVGTATSRNTRLVDSSLRFSGNQIRMSTSSSADIDQSLPAVVSVRASDVEFSHNVAEALLHRGDARANVVIASTTSRVIGNRMTEAACSTQLSLEHTVSRHGTVIGNQASHTIKLRSPDGKQLAVDPSNVSELNSTGCTLITVSPGLIFLGEVFAAGFALGKSAAVPAETASLTASYVDRLAVGGQHTLSAWQRTAASNLVKSVSPLEVVKERLEEGGITDPVPDLIHFQPGRLAVELGESYREITEAVARPLFETAPTAGFVGGLVRSDEGAPIAGARVIIETEDGLSEALDADRGGRIGGTLLDNTVERLRERSTGSALRFRVESSSGELLDRGVLPSVPGDVPAVLDLTVRRR
jgi:hypothetical protein